MLSSAAAWHSRRIDSDFRERLEAQVEYQLQLVEQVRLPLELRNSAIETVLTGSSVFREAVREDKRTYALAHEFAASGYDWARRVSLHVLLGSSAKELIEILTEGFNQETGDLAWANVALACRGGQFIFANDESPSATIEEEIAREMNRRGIDPDRAQIPALSDGFHSGVLVCAAEKEIVLAIDWAARKERVRRARRWDWIRLRPLRWRRDERRR